MFLCSLVKHASVDRAGGMAVSHRDDECLLVDRACVSSSEDNYERACRVPRQLNESAWFANVSCIITPHEIT